MKPLLSIFRLVLALLVVVLGLSTVLAPVLSLAGTEEVESREFEESELREKSELRDESPQERTRTHEEWVPLLPPQPPQAAELCSFNPPSALDSWLRPRRC